MHSAAGTTSALTTGEPVLDRTGHPSAAPGGTQIAALTVAATGMETIMRSSPRAKAIFGGRLFRAVCAAGSAVLVLAALLAGEPLWGVLALIPAGVRHLGARVSRARDGGPGAVEEMLRFSGLAGEGTVDGGVRGVLWANVWAAHELRRERSRLSAVVDDCDVAIVVVERSGRVAVWNTAMARLTGTAAGRAAGRRVTDLFTLTGDDGAAVDLTEMRGGTVRMTTRTGRSLWVRISVSHPAGPDGGGLFTAVLTDTSATRQLDSMRHLLLVSAHHELHGPLTVISGHAQLLGGAVTEQETGESVEAIHDAVETMRRVIRDLDMVVDTDPPSGRPVTNSETIEVSQLLRRALQSIPSVAGRSSVSVPCKIAVRGDPLLLRQCLLLVLGNAGKYAPCGTVSISARAQGDQGVITIADEGPGMADDELQQALTPYYRSVRTRNLPGTGLGLHIAHTMMTAMRGGIELTHAPTGGLQVDLWLPLENTRLESTCKDVPVKEGACCGPC